MNKNNNNSENFTKTNINWYPGHMAKTKREIRENASLIDVVYELIDARIPYSSKIRDLDDVFENKIRILIVTKIDLCDINITKRWKEKYEKDGYIVLMVNLNNSNDYKLIIDETKKLTRNMQNLRVSRGLKEKVIRAMVVGIPNVGKSSLLNRLAGRKVAGVGNTPGVTKNLSWLNVSDDLQIMDTPGILWPKFESNQVALNLAAMTAIKTDVLPIDDVAAHIVRNLLLYYPFKLKERYKLDSISDNVFEILEDIANNTGCMRHGEIDEDKLYNLIINDVRSERIKEVTFDRM